jgi:hypothetical protein
MCKEGQVLCVGKTRQKFFLLINMHNPRASGNFVDEEGTA